MAKVNITIEIDTEEHSMNVSVNGKKIPDVQYVSCYKYHDSYENEDEINCNISCTSKDEESGITTNTNYYTDSSAAAKKIAKADAMRDIPGLIGTKENDPIKAISDFFLNSR